MESVHCEAHNNFSNISLMSSLGGGNTLTNPMDDDGGKMKNKGEKTSVKIKKTKKTKNKDTIETNIINHVEEMISENPIYLISIFPFSISNCILRKFMKIMEQPK